MRCCSFWKPPSAASAETTEQCRPRPPPLPSGRGGRGLVRPNNPERPRRDNSIVYRIHHQICFNALWPHTFELVVQEQSPHLPAVPVTRTNGEDLIWPGRSNNEANFKKLQPIIAAARSDVRHMRADQANIDHQRIDRRTNQDTTLEELAIIRGDLKLNDSAPGRLFCGHSGGWYHHGKDQLMREEVRFSVDALGRSSHDLSRSPGPPRGGGTRAREEEEGESYRSGDLRRAMGRAHEQGW